MYEKLKQAIESGVFSEDLCDIARPPSLHQFDEFCKTASLKPSSEHKELILEWGGSNLDEIRIHGLHQVSSDGDFIEFADDYNGYIFKYSSSGAVFAVSTDGGEIRQLAGSVEEFINDVLLGEKGSDFYGQDWVEELREHGLV